MYSLEKPTVAPALYSLFSRRVINAISDSHSRAADLTSVLSTVRRSKVERLMTLSTSAVEPALSGVFLREEWPNTGRYGQKVRHSA